MPPTESQHKHRVVSAEWTPSVAARAHIGVSQAQARAWFLSLADHPERYRFGSHRGFVFTRGRFGEVGARFETEELFGGIRLTLKFELTCVTMQQFTFVLRHPVTSIYGYFTLEPLETGQTQLDLAIGSPYPGKRSLLHLPVIRGAIQRQIQAEVDHIRQSMEALYQEEI